ncbi:MAG: DNA translocase FtsK [Patescibacteria group bacterium]|nr:DNA translocase FtsK [Patescibacteria group bacterium]
MYTEIILTIIAIIFLLFLLEIIKIRKLLQWNNGLVKIEPVDMREDDELLKEAKKNVIEAQKASISFLQRKLRVGYNKASRLMDSLEKNGIVGPVTKTGQRNVLIKK